MKTPIKFIFALFLGWMVMPTAALSISDLQPPIGPIEPMDPIKPTLCQTASECSDACGSYQYCCPNGNKGTTTTCPYGWTKNLNTCVRESGEGGSDEKGYLFNQYGTCSVTTSTYDCMSPTNNTTGVSGGSMRCMLCDWNVEVRP